VGLRDPDGRREASPGERAARLLQRAVRAPLRELHPRAQLFNSVREYLVESRHSFVEVYYRNSKQCRGRYSMRRTSRRSSGGNKSILTRLANILVKFNDFGYSLK
jgi:hypothetical protein